MNSLNRLLKNKYKYYTARKYIFDYYAGVSQKK